MSLPVVVVGMPPAGPDALDARARFAIEGATLLCGASRHLDVLPHHGEERMDVADVEACVERLRRRGPDEHAVVVASGDPILFGIGSTLLRALGRDEVTVIPAVSSVQEAFARAGLPWETGRVLSAHGRDLASLIPPAMTAGPVAVLCGPDNPPQRVAAALLEAGMEDCRAVVAEWLGGAVERIVDGRLASMARGSFDPFSVLVLDRESPPAGAVFGRPAADFAGEGTMATRGEVRAVALAALRPAGAEVIWDVGAGSGSVGIEAAGLAPGARVLAVERDPERAALLRRNAALLGRGAVTAVEGEAPEALGALPDPDRIVVGGHGGRLGEILGLVRTRLHPGGRTVVLCATLDGVLIARAALGDWSPEILQVTLARGVPAGRSVRLAGEDPVLLVTAVRPA